MINLAPTVLIIDSNKSELPKVETFLREVFAFYHFGDANFNKVLLCISEATVNSIIHGNKGDRKKKVELNVGCNTHIISVKVTDEGEGFDFATLPNPTLQENLLNESGRGIHIIKTIANTIAFNEKGNSMQFEIECT